VFRTGESGVEVLLVHRPQYDDWTIPKGKADPGESDEDCAVREVEEEAGVRAELLWELPTTHYIDSRGRPKRARYWAMRPVAGEAAARAEVDEVRWLSPPDALGRLSYGRDAAVVRAFGHDGGEPLLLVRHASAGHRETWSGDDRERPLDERGRLQADGLPRVFSGHRIGRVVSSPYVRCLQTVEPLTASRGLQVDARAELAEGAGAEAVVAVAAETGSGVLCLHGDALEDVLGRTPRKGATIVAALHNRKLEEIAELPPPA
jgi:ADP-ribose pyrophosphatase YjhB (NUDIX family)